MATHRFESTEPSTELILEHEFATPIAGVAHVRATTYRDGWIIWDELEVYGTLPG